MAVRFDGKRALVTGGSRGIGKAIVEALYKAGAEVFVIGKSEENLQKLKIEFPMIHTVQADLADWQSTRSLVENISHVDIFVNNAGVVDLASFMDTDREYFERALNIYLKAAFNVSQIVARSMIEKASGGAIVNMSSVSSVKPSKGAFSYCVSKAGLDMMTKVMALELGPHKIRVNTVNPTLVPTDMTSELCENPEFTKQILEFHPLGKIARVEDIAQATLFLLSDRADMITGSSLSVDGGGPNLRYRGIGKAIVEALYKAGAEVFVIGKSEENLQKLKTEIPLIRAVQVDLADWEATRSAVENIGHVDLLVNNAGILTRATMMNTTREQLEMEINVNLKAAFNVSQIVARSMISKASGGGIVNISSTLSVKPTSFKAAYCIAKAGLDIMTKVMALELGPHKIRVNTINPCIVPTDMTEDIVKNPDFAKHVEERYPLRKLAQVGDIAQATLFLLDKNADMITGSSLFVDGGLVIS